MVSAKVKRRDLVARLIAYECEELSGEEIIELFQELVDSGQAWQLQGHYGRTARALIDAGYVKDPRTVDRRDGDGDDY